TRRESSLAALATLCWPLDIDIDAISLYQREGQLELLTVVDRIGCYLLQHDAA
ncbi:MurR/RpiR family transcriptional regulator, partial [Citrobacter freundii]